MSITAVVENDTIKLPAGVHLPDGTPVEIHTRGDANVDPKHAWMLKFVGNADLPTDFAAEHDHYLYGSPKRDETK